MSLVGMPRCTQPVPCGHCWYCEQHATMQSPAFLARLTAEIDKAMLACARDSERFFVYGTDDPFAAGWRYTYEHAAAHNRLGSSPLRKKRRRKQ